MNCMRSWLDDGVGAWVPASWSIGVRGHEKERSAFRRCSYNSNQFHTYQGDGYHGRTVTAISSRHTQGRRMLSIQCSRQYCLAVQYAYRGQFGKPVPGLNSFRRHRQKTFLRVISMLSLPLLLNGRNIVSLKPGDGAFFTASVILCFPHYIADQSAGKKLENEVNTRDGCTVSYQRHRAAGRDKSVDRFRRDQSFDTKMLLMHLPCPIDCKIC